MARRTILFERYSRNCNFFRYGYGRDPRTCPHESDSQAQVFKFRCCDCGATLITTENLRFFGWVILYGIWWLVSRAVLFIGGLVVIVALIGLLWRNDPTVGATAAEGYVLIPKPRSSAIVGIDEDWRPVLRKHALPLPCPEL